MTNYYYVASPMLKINNKQLVKDAKIHIALPRHDTYGLSTEAGSFLQTGI